MKLVGKDTNWTISENEGETFSSTSWSRLNVWVSVLHGYQSTHKGTATRSASPCQSHTEQRTAPDWKFWLWELHTTVIKQYDKHPNSEHADPIDADAKERQSRTRDCSKDENKMVLLQKFLNIDTLPLPSRTYGNLLLNYIQIHHHSHLSISTGGGQIVAT
jgi:hypothetical protein